MTFSIGGVKGGKPMSIRPEPATTRRSVWWIVIVPSALLLLLAAGVVPVWYVIHLTGQRYSIGGLLERYAGTAVDLVTFTGSIGLLTMAVVEAAKRLMPLRGLFQYSRLQGLLLPVNVTALAYSPSLGSARLGSSRLATVSWFDVPADQLIAQISAIVEPGLERFLIALPVAGNDRDLVPVDHLLPALLGFASGDELTRWAFGHLEAVSVTSRSTPTSEGRSPRGSRRTPDTQAPDQDRADRFRRDQLELILRTELEHSLDRLHITIGSDWRRFLRVLSCLVAGGLAAGVVGTQDRINPLTAALVAVGSALIAGFFSWLARDLVAIVGRLRPL
jgi:hypothetical protein